MAVGSTTLETGPVAASSVDLFEVVKEKREREREREREKEFIYSYIYII